MTPSSSRACIDRSFHRAPSSLRCQLDQRVEDNIKDKRNRTREQSFFAKIGERERERGADRKRCVEPSITERRGDERGVQLNRSRSASDREREKERERKRRNGGSCVTRLENISRGDAAYDVASRFRRHTESAVALNHGTIVVPPLPGRRNSTGSGCTTIPSFEIRFSPLVSRVETKILERSEEEASGQREKEKGKKNDQRSLDQRVHVLAWSVRPPPIDLARA